MGMIITEHDHDLIWLIELLEYRLEQMGLREKTLNIKHSKAGVKLLIKNLRHAGQVNAALLAALQWAIARIEGLNAEGNPILSAWLPDAKAAIALAEGGEQ